MVAKHFLIEFYGCRNLSALCYQHCLEPLALEAAKLSTLNIIGRIFHQFEPAGVTGIILLAESHISLHSWPEHRYLALDFFSCNPKASPSAFLHYLRKEIIPKEWSVEMRERGNVGEG